MDENHSDESFRQKIDDAYEDKITENTILAEDTIEEIIKAELP